MNVSWGDPHSRLLSVALGSLVLLTVVVAGVASTSAATKFRIRGNVIEVNDTDKTMSMYVTHIQKGWPIIQLGRSAYTIRLSNPMLKTYMRTRNNTLGTVSAGSMFVGDEVIVVGETRSDGSLDAKSVVIRTKAAP